MDPRKYAEAPTGARIAGGITEQVEDAATNVQNLVNRLEEIADRMCGVADKEMDNRLQAVPDGLFNRITDQCRAISAATSRGHEILNRITDRL